MAKSTVKIEATTPDCRVHGGHRSRMKEKMMNFGDMIFDSHELLEMLLYQSIPMRDTNPIAHRLLGTFGSLEGVFSASREELMTVEGVKEKTADLLLATAKIADFPFFCKQNATKYNSHRALGQYFVELYREVRTNQTHMMMLTNSMELISTELVAEGDLYKCQRSIKDMIILALKRGAPVVIIAHNHPNGPLYESADDHFTYNCLKSAFQSTGILFLENYIISGDGYYSTVGKIDTLNFYQTPEIEQFLSEKESGPNAYVAMRP